MKYPILPAAFALLAAPALAGSPEALVFQAPEVVPAAQTDWSGFYAGGLVSFDSAVGLLQLQPGGNSPMLDSTSYGAFAGYNIQKGAFVYGGEFAVSSGGLTSTIASSIYYEQVFDLKARAGYSFGKIFAYGVVGGSYSNLHWNNLGLAAPSYGLAFGAGVEYMLGDHMVVGAEYLVRGLSGEFNNGNGQVASTTIQSAQLRVGWKF